MDQIPYRLPLVIGVTGHRDLRDQDIPALERAVGEAIKRLKRDYLHGDKETPLIVLSALAEGADRLIARVAMAQGAKLIAPLPMEPDEYRRDFEPGLKPDAAAEFDRMKSEALAAPVMRYANDNTRENVREESRRALQYREVGLFIVRHCHVLIALWNGDEHDPSVGGTAEVVSFKRDGIPLDAAASVRASLDAPEMGPVIHVVTPRAKPGGNVKDVQALPWGVTLVRPYRGSAPGRMWKSFAKFMASVVSVKITDDSLPTDPRKRREFQSWEAFETKAALTRRFNREAARLEASPARAQQLRKSLDYLFDDEKDPAKKPLADAAKECAMKLVPHWCSLYQLADTLAQRWQKRFVADLGRLFALGFLAIFSFEMGTHVFFDFDLFFLTLALYSLFLFFGFCLFIYAHRRQHQERFLDYRALAEALRVAVFWKLVGIGWPTDRRAAGALRSSVDLNSPDAVADAYPIRQPSELDWVKTCLRTLELLDADKSSADLKHRIETEGDTWARTFWVRGQLAFFRGRGPEHDHRAEVLENRSFVLVIVSLVVAVGLCLIDAMLLDGAGHRNNEQLGWGHAHWLHRMIILLIGLLPGLAAVWTGYAERRALKAQARQYDRMRVVFERANDLLQSPRPADFAKNQVLYAELGAEAMEENAEWVAIYRQRPIRPP
jgi:hypothetical protein